MNGRWYFCLAYHCWLTVVCQRQLWSTFLPINTWLTFCFDRGVHTGYIALSPYLSKFFLLNYVATLCWKLDSATTASWGSMLQMTTMYWVSYLVNMRWAVWQYGSFPSSSTVYTRVKMVNVSSFLEKERLRINVEGEKRPGPVKVVPGEPIGG